jgi:hypothetical protein
MTSAQRRFTAANQLDRVGGCDEPLAPRPPPPRDRVELRHLAKSIELRAVTKLKIALT